MIQFTLTVQLVGRRVGVLLVHVKYHLVIMFQSIFLTVGSARDENHHWNGNSVVGMAMKVIGFFTTVTVLPVHHVGGGGRVIPRQGCISVGLKILESLW
jgi:hypothetical protein